MSGEDYDGITDAIVSFAACQRRSCVLVNITDDEILEDIESFTFTLERTSELDASITLEPVDGTLEIIDNDGMFYSKCTDSVVYIMVNYRCCGWSGEDLLHGDRECWLCRSVCYNISTRYTLSNLISFQYKALYYR